MVETVFKGHYTYFDHVCPRYAEHFEYLGRAMKVQLIGSTELPTRSSLLEAVGETLIVMPYIDDIAAKRCAALLASRAGCDGFLLAVRDDEREGFIALTNRIFRMTESTFFGYVAQDAFPGRHWLALALQALRTREAGKQGLFAFNDGKWIGALASFGIAARGWALSNYGGDLFFSGYRRHFADVELSMLAMSERRYCYDPNSVLVELDWDKDHAVADKADRFLFQVRKGTGFDQRVADPRLLEMFA